MFERDSLRGIIPPLPTPLTSAGEVDRRGMQRLVDYLLDGGVHGIFVLGSTGEFAFLTPSQRVQVVEAAVNAVHGRVPVIAGISAIGTREAIDHGRAAHSAGADFLMATPPFFGRMEMSQASIEDHLRALADETDGRLLLYNVPPLINDIEGPTIARLAEHERIVGMKDSASIIHVQDVVFRTRARNFRVLVGVEYHLVAALLVGAHGGTPATANVTPRWFADIYESTLAGDLDAAFATQERANRFTDALVTVPSWSGAIKGALSLLGLCGPTTAAPVAPASPEDLAFLRTQMTSSGLL